MSHASFGSSCISSPSSPASSSASPHVGSSSQSNVKASPAQGLESGTSISAGDVPVSEENNSSTSAPPYHLHSLTERKLEKAVLGRAVGLRQLVLLSNAFATRPSPPPPAPSHASSQSGYNAPFDNRSLQYPHASTSRSVFEDEETDAGIIEFEEDEAERKRREEDWLDSVLDEMLTDAEDEEEEKQETFSQQQTRRISTRSEREFREPYVHLSIKHAWQSSQIHHPIPSTTDLIPASSSNLAAQHAAMLQHETDDDNGHYETASSPSALSSEQWMGDSGFMEPHAIPLPESTDASPNSSANSQASEEEREEEEDYPPGYMFPAAAENDNCLRCRESEDRWKTDTGHTQMQDDNTPEANYPNVGIPILTGPSTALPSSNSFTSLSLPELAYSATSLNTLSSSASHSLHLFTPGTSPPAALRAHHEAATPSSAEQEKEAWRAAQQYEAEQARYQHDYIEAQEITLPMDDMDLFDEDAAREVEERRSSSSKEDDDRTSSNGSTTSNEDSTFAKRRHTRTLLPLGTDLVPYQPSRTAERNGKEKEDDALRIPIYLPLSTDRHHGLFSSRPMDTQKQAPMPALPPSLLSVMMGRSPAVEFDFPTASRTSSCFQSQPREAQAADHSSSASLTTEKLKLPMFLPSEIVKSLYDSVDFGHPPRFSSPSVTPLTCSSQQSSSLLPNFDFTEGTSAKASCQARGPGSSSAKSAPNSPRSRSKSLTQVDPCLPVSGHASPGGLLFSSFGLFGVRDEHSQYPKGAGHMPEEDETVSPRRRSLSSTPLDSIMHNATFSTAGRARSIMVSSPHAARNESRSPSRLRLFLQRGDNLADDFEFGTV